MFNSQTLGIKKRALFLNFAHAQTLYIFLFDNMSSLTRNFEIQILLNIASTEI